MTPELWIALVGVTLPPVATVAVAWINRRRNKGERGGEREAAG